MGSSNSPIVDGLHGLRLVRLHVLLQRHYIQNVFHTAYPREQTELN